MGTSAVEKKKNSSSNKSSSKAKGGQKKSQPLEVKPSKRFDSLPLTTLHTDAQECPNCGQEALVRKRSFSEQAWTVLLLWNEITPNAVDQPICNECYEDVREILIDRTDEIETAIRTDDAKPLKRNVSSLAS